MQNIKISSKVEEDTWLELKALDSFIATKKIKQGLTRFIGYPPGNGLD